jgi:tetratricopeptide (TPR) repeat protein
MFLRCTATILLLAAPAAAQEAPEPPTLRWAKSVNALAVIVVPAAGTHLTAELPVEATIDDGGAFRVTWREPEVPPAGPLKLLLPRVAGEGSTGWTLAARGGICADDGSTCLPWHASVDVPRRGAARGRVRTERGSLPGPATAEGAPAMEPGWHEATDADAIAAAYARSADSGKPLLIDFFAVWCPPCDRMRDEVLHDPMRAALLDRFVLLRADADHPASFGLKDRYRVGGYPTVLLVAADGALLDRIVGYEGPEAFAARLESAVPATDADLLGRLAGTLPGSGQEAQLRLALSRRAEAAGDAARAWLLVEPLDPLGDRLEPADRLRAVGLALDAGVDGAEAMALDLADRLPLRSAGLVSRMAGLWLEAGRDAEASELTARWYARLAERPWGAVDPPGGPALGQVPGRSAEEHERLAEAGWYRAGWGSAPKPDYARAALHQAAAMLLEAGLAPDGDPWAVSLDPLLAPDYLKHHEGRVHDLLDLLERAGRFEEAARFYPAMIALQPDAFTWHFRLAGHFVKRGGWEEALVSADRAVERGYGDNRLRAIKRRAEILLELQRPDDALASLDAALAEAPPDVENVRTWRYRQQLEALRERALSQSGPR